MHCVMQRPGVDMAYFLQTVGEQQGAEGSAIYLQYV